jgi:tetratricopeptide (TPR) repeat protein
LQKIRHWALIILGVGALLLGVIGLVSLGAYTSASRRQTALTPWRDPTTAVREQSIAPDLALLPLTGMDDAETVSRALFANELESAYSVLVYSTSLSDSERAGKWLLLGQRYQASGEVERARSCYRTASEIATLSPFMTDLARAQTFLQAGTGLTAVQAYGDGELLCDQAHDVALYSPHLTQAHRQQILQGLQSAYTALGLGEEKWLDLARLVTGGQATAPRSQQIPVAAVPPLPNNSEVEQAEVTRQAATENMLVVLVPPQREPSKYLLEALTEALQAEDQVKQRVYSDEATAAADLPTQVALANERVVWLTLKLRIARRATGLSLVSDWETAEAEIREQLQVARETLYDLYARYAEGETTLTLIRQQILAGRLGLYPDYPEETLANAVNDAKVQSDSPLHLRILAQQGARYFVLTGKP